MLVIERMSMLCVCVGVLACGPDSGSDADNGGVDESSSGAPSDGAMCLVPDGHLMLEFRVNAVGVDTDCTVVDVVALTPGELEIQLDCGSPMSLRYTTLPVIMPALAAGDAVEISTVDEESYVDGYELRTSMFIRAPTGKLLIAAVSSRREDWTAELAPLQLQRIEGACADQPTQGDCTTGTRAMWEATVDGMSTVVGDSNSTRIGPYTTYIVRADASDLLECLDVETRDYRALIVRTE